MKLTLDRIDRIVAEWDDEKTRLLLRTMEFELRREARRSHAPDRVKQLADVFRQFRDRTFWSRISTLLHVDFSDDRHLRPRLPLWRQSHTETESTDPFDSSFEDMQRIVTRRGLRLLWVVPRRELSIVRHNLPRLAEKLAQVRRLPAPLLVPEWGKGKNGSAQWETAIGHDADAGCFIPDHRKLFAPNPNAADPDAAYYEAAELARREPNASRLLVVCRRTQRDEARLRRIVSGLRPWPDIIVYDIHPGYGYWEDRGGFRGALYWESALQRGEAE